MLIKNMWDIAVSVALFSDMVFTVEEYRLSKGEVMVNGHG